MNKITKIYLAIIILSGAIIRLAGLGTRPFDGDEGIIVLISNSSWQDLFTRASLDVHPPLYHLLLKLFLSFGVSEFSVRLLSAITGVVFIYLIFIFTKKILPASPVDGNKKIALLASFLAAISPYLIYPSQEARMYALFAVFAILSYYFFYDLISQKPTVKSVMGYIIFSVAVFYTQYLGFVIVGSQFLYLVIYQRSILKQYKTWLFSYVAMLVLFIPQLSTAFAQFSARTTEQAQTGGLLDNLKGLFGAFYRFGAGRLFLDINPSNIKILLFHDPLLFVLFLLSIIVPMFLFIVGCVYLYRTNRKAWIFLIFPIAVAMILALVSREVGSRASRYFIYIYPMYLIFLAQGIALYWSGYKKILPILLVIVFICGLVVHYNRDLKSPGVNKIARFISDNAAPNDLALVRGGFGGGEKWVLEYYLSKNSSDESQMTSISVSDMFENYTPGNLAQLKAIKPQDKIAQLLEDHDKVYFYDMTYSVNQISGAKENILGYDKEGKPLTVWEVSK